MGAITIFDKAVKEFAEVAGVSDLKRIRKLKLEINPDEPVYIQVEYYPDSIMVENITDIVKKYVLHEKDAKQTK